MIPSSIACDETVITERNGTWVVVLKYNNQTGFVQEDLKKIDSIIANNPLIKDRKLQHHPFRKKQPIESLNRTSISGQENRFKDFTATPFNTTDSWSNILFPPRNITTASRGAGGRSTKTAISIDDDTTVATLADTVTNLQRSVEKLTREMVAMGNKVAKEESRGNIVAVKTDSLEDTQKVISESLVLLVNGTKESKDAARKEASELKEMMRQMNNNKDKTEWRHWIQGRRHRIQGRRHLN
jgi:hypothetical protein